MPRRLIAAVALLLSLAGLNVLPQLIAPPTAQAQTPQVAVNMPFAGQWANNFGTEPAVHSPYYGDWAIDLFAGQDTAVKLDVTSPNGPVTFTKNRENDTCSNYGAGIAGRGIVLNVLVNGVVVGSIDYEHLDNISAGPYTNGMTLGTITREPLNNTCYSARHAHVELKNNTAGTFSCYVSKTIGSNVAAGAAIGVLGSSNTGKPQTCASVPTGGTTSTNDDFNLDQRDDLAWFEAWNGGKVTLYRANADGNSFAFGGTLAAGLGKPDWAATGDFNNDGRTDLVWYETAARTLTVLRGLPENGYQVVGSTGGVGKPDWAGVGDFNLDGRDDVAWYEAWNGGKVSLYSANADGNSFAFGGTIASNLAAPQWAGVGDFNNDERADLAWLGTGETTLKVLRGVPGTGYGVAGATALGKPDWAGIGDFNLDGRDDLAWYEAWNGGKVSLYSANADGGSFAPGGTLVSGFGAPTWAGVGDFNNDGRADIAWHTASDQRVRTLRGTPSGYSVTGMTALGAPDWAAAS